MLEHQVFKVDCALQSRKSLEITRGAVWLGLFYGMAAEIIPRTGSDGYNSDLFCHVLGISTTLP